ncbi:hypothetical protein CON85_23515 [Bacillus toyonensis]|uniref:hypothetical protein n=1 Tax=Bacillus toyonensis TaxID=155322 RepID=UPI000BECAEF2|nr:hypothetical protein [Bacillus toyonensis]PDZ26447.1 hypothetical protein CON85_23515 [Bacillus toyonensis]
MSEQSNIVIENLIRNWGLPPCIKKIESDIDYKFDDNELTNTTERGYGFEGGKIKFCLYDKTNRSVLFSMDFHKINPRLAAIWIVNGKSMSEKSIKLELLYVHDESLRKQGISSYYIEKLRNYAIQEGMECIYVKADANASNFNSDKKKNALSQEELEKFYDSKWTDEMPIIRIN